MKNKLIGVIGLGSIGLRHARNIKALGCDVLGFDPSVDAQTKFQQVCENACVPVSRQSLLEKSDAVVIASPNRFHLDDLGAAVTAGVPALVEKPLGHSLELANKSLNAAQSADVTVVSAHNLRFRKVVKRVHAILKTEMLGSPVWARFFCGSWLPQWRPDTDYRKNYAADSENGGVIFDIIHEFDLAIHLLGAAETKSCVALSSGLLDMKSEDLAEIVMEHDSGCLTSLHLDYITRPRERYFTIAGSKGVMRADLRSGELVVKDISGQPLINEKHTMDPNAEYILEMEDFLAVVYDGKKPNCPGEEVLRSLKAVVSARHLAGLPHAD